MRHDSLAVHLLDILIDNPSSVAALWQAVAMAGGSCENLSIDRVTEALEELEARGWVRALQMHPDGALVKATELDRWQARVEYPRVTVDLDNIDTAIDEVGLLYEITERGRRAWRRIFSGDTRKQTWMINDVTQDRVIVVRATTEDAAEKAVQEYMRYRPEIALHTESRSVKKTSFSLASGVPVDGIVIEIPYSVELRDRL